MKHDFYTNADKDRPEQICDRNGQVALGMCKVCGQAESDLQETCPGAPPQPDKTCQINIHNVLGWNLDPAMTRKALEVAARWVPGAAIIEIYPTERVPADAPVWKNPGWLEWTVRVLKKAPGDIARCSIEIHIIQRQIGAEFECHS